jgi:hypothetical protein
MVKVPAQVGIPVHVNVIRRESPLGPVVPNAPETCAVDDCATAVEIHIAASAATARRT